MLQDFLRPPNVTDVADDRTLSPETQSLTANAVLTHPLPHGMIGTINATLSASQSVAMQGLPGLALTIPTGDPFSPFSQAVVDDRYVDQPLRQYVNTWGAHLGGTLNKDVDSWRLSLTTAWDHSDTQTDTDTGIDASPLQALLDAGSASFNPFAPMSSGLLQGLPQSYARSITDSGNVQVLANGPLIKEPAGNIYVSAKAGDSESWQASYSARGGATQSVYLTRNDLNAQLSLDIPIASRDEGFLPFLGRAVAQRQRGHRPAVGLWPARLHAAMASTGRPSPAGTSSSRTRTISRRPRSNSWADRSSSPLTCRSSTM